MSVWLVVAKQDMRAWCMYCTENIKMIFGEKTTCRLHMKSPKQYIMKFMLKDRVSYSPANGQSLA